MFIQGKPFTKNGSYFMLILIYRDKDRERRNRDRGNGDDEFEEKVRIKIEPPDGNSFNQHLNFAHPHVHDKL